MFLYPFIPLPPPDRECVSLLQDHAPISGAHGRRARSEQSKILCSRSSKKKTGSMYSTIGSGTASQATPQGRRHKRAGVGFELAIKRSPARRHDH